MEHRQGRDRRDPTRAPLLLGLLAVVTLVLALAVDPGSGTGTNLQPAGDAAGLVVGAHHAKPVPQSGGAVVGIALLALAASVLLAAGLIARPAAGLVIRRSVGAERLPRSLVSWSARVHRAPPRSRAAA